MALRMFVPRLLLTCRRETGRRERSRRKRPGGDRREEGGSSPPCHGDPWPGFRAHCGVCGVLPDPSPFSPGVWGGGGGPAVALASVIWEAAERGQISVASPEGRGLPQAPGPCLPRTPPGRAPCRCSCSGQEWGGALLWTLRPSWERGQGHFHEVSGRGGQNKVPQTLRGPGQGTDRRQVQGALRPRRDRPSRGGLGPQGKGISGWSRRPLRAHSPFAART